jgi:hypothetical protein
MPNQKDEKLRGGEDTEKVVGSKGAVPSLHLKKSP